MLNEFSMDGASMLRKLDLRCKLLKPESSHQPFGDMFIYFFGDLKQFPPVQDQV